MINVNFLGNVLINVMVYLMRCLVIFLCFIIKFDNIKKGMVKRVKLFNLFIICWVMVMVVGVIFIFISMVSNVVILMLMEIGMFNSNKVKNMMIKIMLVNFIIVYLFEVEIIGW